jgi:inner membrane protein involved in colicin E2 resistance
MRTRRGFFGWWVALSFSVMALLASGIRFGMAFGLASALLVGAALLSVALDERTPAAVRLLPVAGGR